MSHLLAFTLRIPLRSQNTSTKPILIRLLFSPGTLLACIVYSLRRHSHRTLNYFGTSFSRLHASCSTHQQRVYYRTVDSILKCLRFFLLAVISSTKWIYIQNHPSRHRSCIVGWTRERYNRHRNDWVQFLISPILRPRERCDFKGIVVCSQPVLLEAFSLLQIFSPSERLTVQLEVLEHEKEVKTQPKSGFPSLLRLSTSFVSRGIGIILV